MQAFEPFLDAEDLSACVQATETAASLDARLQGGSAVWPLSLAPDQPLGELFLSAKACSRSFRFGGLGDNVLGLGWRLPNGNKVQLGGRVVKNVAGFDLIRFLAASGGRFGAPELMVLRLRPRPEAERILELRGPLPALRELARKVRHSSWAHALDALDLEADPQTSRVILAFGGRTDVLGLLDQEAGRWIHGSGLALTRLASLPARHSQPWARVQAPMDLLPELAGEWLQRYGGKVAAFLGQGVLQIEAIDKNEAGALQGLHELHQRMAVLGGHAEHPSLEPEPSAPQARWERALLRQLETA